jgi:polyisoprenoid-binding protein YceI
VVVGLLLVAALAAGGLWYLFLRPGGPPAVISPPGASAAPGATAGATAGVTAAGSPATTETPATAGGSTWTVDASIGSFSDFSSSFAGYRVQEQLVNVGGNTAVGRTPEVTGELTLDGTTVTAASFRVQLSGLESDDSRRDGRVGEALAVRQYPQAVFVLGAPIQLGSIPADGQEVNAVGAGKLKIRGVTRDVEFPLTAALSGDVLTIKGALEIRLADFSIPKPSSFLVLSIADVGTIEVQLRMTRGG